MPPEPFEYALLRVVPRVERGEAVNVGVVVFCRTRRYLDVRIALEARQISALRALFPEVDLDAVRAHLESIHRTVEGRPDAGPLGALDAPERFRWVTAPASTMIQPGDVHGGLTDDPARSLDDLFERLVR